MPLNGRKGLVVGTTTSGISEGGIRHTGHIDICCWIGLCRPFFDTSSPAIPQVCPSAPDFLPDTNVDGVYSVESEQCETENREQQ
jgi:hypothetical protein